MSVSNGISSKTKPCVIVVEDEPAQQEVLRYNLISEGCEVLTASNGDDAITMLYEIRPNLVLLDWMLPGVSGIEICRQIKSKKEWRNIPVIMLSARSEEIDRVRGLETGADDYVTKPFSMQELLARVRTHLRKSHPLAVGETTEYSGIKIDGETYRVFRNGREIHLSPTEFRLLSTMISRPDRAWTREQLLDRVWGRDIYVDTRTVDVHVGRLRKALTAEGEKDPIRTIRAVGYALTGG